MKELKTIHGEILLVDDEDYEKAKQYRWTTMSNGGRPRVIASTRDEKSATYKKLILGTGSKFTLQKNDNPFDLRKENIMVFDTKSEYAKAISKLYPRKPVDSAALAKRYQGRSLRTNQKSTYIGAIYEKDRQRPWIARIVQNRKIHNLGSFIKDEYAGVAYDIKAIELYGPDAVRNFPHLTLEELMEKMKQIKEEDAILFHDFASKRQQGTINNVPKSSQYVGVHYSNRGDRDIRKYKAIVQYHKKNRYIGGFTKEEYAALAYDKKVLEIYGNDAVRNFPDLTPEELTEKFAQIKAEEALRYHDQPSRKQQGAIRTYKDFVKSSQYVGVTFDKECKRWRAAIRYTCRSIASR